MSESHHYSEFRRLFRKRLQRQRDERRIYKPIVGNVENQSKGCLYCGGKLRELIPEVAKVFNASYSCSRCGRMWRTDEEGNWIALYDSGSKIKWNKFGERF